MISHFYFNWHGPREGVTEYGKKLEAACKRTGIKFIGVYAPHQDNWNYVSIIEARVLEGGLTSALIFGFFIC